MFHKFSLIVRMAHATFTEPLVGEGPDPLLP